MKMPADKFMSSVKVGEKGQIVIPKEVREMFNIDPGDMLLLLADKERGIAIVDNDGLLDMARNIAGFAGKKEEEKP
jgi:AbrB family looped-hinge helix DNA binding protein